MPKNKLPPLETSDAKMLELIDILRQKGIIRFKQEFCDAVEIHKQNIRNIEKLRIQHFSAEHIRNACKEYKVNANWIFGLEENVFRGSKAKLVKVG